jgi:flavorubredoxin
MPQPRPLRVNDATVDHLTAGLYRIRVMTPDAPISFNQFLIDDEKPALIHTGMFPMYDQVRESVAEVLDPSSIRYVCIGHFEADECGGMHRFVDEAPQAELVCSQVGAYVSLEQWDFDGAVRSVQDGDRVDLGSHTLRFWETPHVHHWDSMMVLEETTESLFPADLFMQPGEQPPINDEDLGDEMCAMYRDIGIFGHEDPVLQVVDRVEETEPKLIHPMHGASFTREALPNYIEALREQPFAFQGEVFGRSVPHAH